MTALCLSPVYFYLNNESNSDQIISLEQGQKLHPGYLNLKKKQQLRYLFIFTLQLT